MKISVKIIKGSSQELPNLFLKKGRPQDFAVYKNVMDINFIIKKNKNHGQTLHSPAR